MRGRRNRSPLGDGMAKIFLIRHGEPEIRGVLLGQSDPSLSAFGREQAREVLADLRPGIVWTSPLRRARETAALVANARICEREELREMDMGEWTGLTWKQVEHSWEELAREKMADWFGVPAPGGESWPVFLSRVQRAWAVIRYGPANAAVVAHHGVHAALRFLIDGRDPAQFQQQYCEVISLDYDPFD
jgi:glucosyl-3-phosphoglycerate phosphatase